MLTSKLPVDIFKLISLYLKPYTFSVCCSLHKMYTDFWFKDKLILEYPDMELINTVDWNYKYFYKRSLLSGNIYTFNRNENKYNSRRKLKDMDLIDIEAIKIEHIDLNTYLVLEFNGTLWCYSDILYGKILLDTHVIDIDTNTYIKHNAWYYVSNTEDEDTEEDTEYTDSDDDYIDRRKEEITINPYIEDNFEYLMYDNNNDTSESVHIICRCIIKIYKSEEQFMQVIHSNNDYVYALTSTKLYVKLTHYRFEKLKITYFNTVEVTSHNLLNTPIKMITNGHELYILDISGNVMRIKLSHTTPIKNKFFDVKNMIKDLIVFNNGSYYTLNDNRHHTPMEYLLILPVELASAKLNDFIRWPRKLFLFDNRLYYENENVIHHSRNRKNKGGKVSGVLEELYVTQDENVRSINHYGDYIFIIIKN